MRVLLLAGMLLILSGCLGDDCVTLGYRSIVETTEDFEAIRSALLAEGWVELQNDGPRPVFRLGDRYTATVYDGPASTHTIEFDHRTEDGARALAAPVAQRLGEDVTVKPMEHCGSV